MWNNFSLFQSLFYSNWIPVAWLNSKKDILTFLQCTGPWDKSMVLLKFPYFFSPTDRYSVTFILTQMSLIRLRVPLQSAAADLPLSLSDRHTPLKMTSCLFPIIILIATGINFERKKKKSLVLEHKVCACIDNSKTIHWQPSHPQKTPASFSSCWSFGTSCFPHCEMVLFRCCSSSYFNIHLGNGRKLETKVHRGLGNSGRLQYTVRHVNKRKTSICFSKAILYVAEICIFREMQFDLKAQWRISQFCTFINVIARTTASKIFSLARKADNFILIFHFDISFWPVIWQGRISRG